MRGGTFLVAALFTAIASACGQTEKEPPPVLDRHAHCDLSAEKPEAVTDLAAAEPVARELRAWAQHSLPNEPRDREARFWMTRLPCNEMVVAWLVGRRFCGTGGCSLFVWDTSDERLRPLARIPVTWAPIRLVEGRAKGRPILAVWTQGGGIQPGYERPFHFDGTEYPMTTGDDWKRKVAPGAAGIVLIPELGAMEDGLPLYRENGG
ncbi:MAG TPA: hypothetical protein PKD99_12010 [Sphingopyxis sp.]|nr:hypothetical protein [Sphingopyxis sp.]HMP45824.1 hypothetical protein [Sphingopyxis sp.]HMQ18830.1 hypothetical protein [Sphingopyxis sp.]